MATGSITSIEAQAKRALAEIAKRRAITFTPAKRGDLCVVERRHSYTALYGAYRGSVDYTLCRVVSVDREGYAKAVEAGNGTRWTKRDWQQVGHAYTTQPLR